MASIDNPDAGLHAIDKIAKPAREKDRSYRGFNLFLGEDHSLFITLARGEWNISGFRASDLRSHLRDLSTGRASYWLKRLRTHGLIKKIGHRYKYYLTTFGRGVLTTALSIREYVVMPCLSTARPMTLFAFLHKISWIRD